MPEQPYNGEMSFEEVVHTVNQLLNEWFEGDRTTPPELSRFEDTIYLKNSARIITHVNPTYQKVFANGELPVGKHGNRFLRENIVKVSEFTDLLLLDGMAKIECEHIGSSSDGSTYKMRSYKRSLLDRHYEPYTILGITRLVSLIDESTNHGSRSVHEYFQLYQSLSESSKRLCQLHASGYTSREIAEELDLTTRSIEKKRKQILEKFELKRPMELVILMVRFQERGMLE